MPESMDARKKRMTEIIALAKKIRSKSPNKKWTECVAEAGKSWKKSK